MKRRHNMPFGAEYRDDGTVRFRLWAPAARQVELCLAGSSNATDLSLERCDNGWFELVTNAAKLGAQYRFRIDGDQEVPDPASRFQPEDVHGASEVINPVTFNWKDDTCWKTLSLRKQWPDVFQRGEYLPLTVQGARADQIVAFIRKSDNASVLVAVPRLVASLLGDSNLPPIGSKVWEDTNILVPVCGSCETFRNAFTGEVIDLPKADAKIAVSELLSHFPAALCMLGESPVSARRQVHPRGR
jgi:hypothetical protein